MPRASLQGATDLPGSTTYNSSLWFLKSAPGLVSSPMLFIHHRTLNDFLNLLTVCDNEQRASAPSGTTYRLYDRSGKARLVAGQTSGVQARVRPAAGCSFEGSSKMDSGESRASVQVSRLTSILASPNMHAPFIYFFASKFLPAVKS